MTLLERESQLAALAQYASEARGRSGRLVLVSGEAGIGKTSLIEELEQDLPDARWAWGACDGLFTPRPLAPLHDLVRGLGESLSQVMGAGGSRDQIFDAVLRSVSDEDGLVVLVVEDVHWADEATLDLLRFLGRRIRDQAVLLLTTFRNDSLAPDDPLRVAVGELSRHRFTRRIDLPPLTTAGVRRLAHGSPFAPDELYALTGGNPFFLTEVLQSGVSVPLSVRDAVLARTAHLDETARAALDLVSLDGGRIDPDVLVGAGGVTDSTLDLLVAAGLLVDDGGAYRFRHELARHAVAQEIPTLRRTAAHRALLTSLTQQGCQDHARLAYHAESAGLAELVRRHAPEAARTAAALGAHREATAQYQRALRFAPADPHELATLYDEYADQLAFIDQWPLAAETRERAVELWTALGDTRSAGHDQRKLCTVYWRLCRGPESVAALQHAIELLEPLGDDGELAYAYSVRAFALWPAEPGLARDMLRRAEDMAARLGDPVVLSDVLNNVAAGEFAERRDWTGPMRSALRVAVDAGAEHQAARAYANLHSFFLAEHRFLEAERYFREGSAYCDERDIPTFATCLRGHRALALVDLGRWDEAVELAEQVLATPASPINHLTSQVTLGLVHARRGTSGGIDLLDVAVAEADGVDETEWIALARTARVEAHWLSGDDDRARADLVAVRARISALEYPEDARLSVWERRLLGVASPASPAPQPWSSWIAGDFDGTATKWDARGCGYEAAMALADSDDDARLREAIARFEALGAAATAHRTRRRMRELGLRAVPRGTRASTRVHPFGLTAREDDVLTLLCEGLTNAQIADRLVLSTRTVDHHVSAVLSKMGASTRRAAVAQVRREALAAT